MQFNPVVLFVGSLPAGASSQRYKKRGEFGQNIQKKAENKKKRASSPEPLASCSCLFIIICLIFFTCIKLLPENQSFFLPLKTNFKPIK